MVACNNSVGVKNGVEQYQGLVSEIEEEREWIDNLDTWILSF